MKVARGPKAETRRGAKSLRAVVILLACLCCAAAATPQAQQQQQTRLQGQVYYRGKSTPYPAAYVRVTVTPEAARNAGKTNGAKEVYTGRDGWFYFTIPAGSYVLEVWGSGGKSAGGKPVGSYRIRVAGPTTTIKTIMLP